MEEPISYGFLSLLPPIIAIVLAIATRQVFISLLVGIFLGFLIINNWNPLLGFFDTIEGLVAVFNDPGNARTVMFCALVGALILFMQKSGGIEGFIQYVNRRLQLAEADGSSRIKVQFLAWLTGLLIFVESSISVLTVGALYRPIADKLGISREKLAYLADSSSAPSSILIPFNGWGAFIMGLLAAEGFSDPFATMMEALTKNFYAWLALLLALFIALSGRDFGPMKRAEERVRNGGPLLPEGATPMISEELTDVEKKAGVQPRARNMIVPILVMVLLMPIMLAYTGWPSALTERPDAGTFDQILFAIGQGSGSTAVLTAVIGSILISMFFYKAQGIMGIREMFDLTLKGVAGMVPIALLILLAFAIGSLCRQLGTGLYVAEVSQAWLSPGLAPALIFVISCFIAFSTGTSWGTFGIMIPIAVPMAQQMGVDPVLAIAAALGGGVFGDHCSPISDTTILSSMASATDHIAHVRTQLPYALIAGGTATLLYLIVGFL